MLLPKELTHLSFHRRPTLTASVLVLVPVLVHLGAGRASGPVFLPLVLSCSPSPAWLPHGPHTRSPVQRKTITLVPPVIESVPGAPGCSQDNALSPWLGVRGLLRTVPRLPLQLLPRALPFSCTAPPSRSRRCSARLLQPVSIGFLFFVGDALTSAR